MIPSKIIAVWAGARVYAAFKQLNFEGGSLCTHGLMKVRSGLTTIWTNCAPSSDSGWRRNSSWVRHVRCSHQPPILTAISAITFSRLKNLDVSYNGIESMEPLSRFDAPELKRLSIGKDGLTRQQPYQQSESGQEAALPPEDLEHR